MKYQNVIEQFLKIVPEFDGAWIRFLDSWEEDERTLGLALAEFVGVYAEQAKDLSREKKLRLFQLAEQQMLSENIEIVAAISTSFLEGLQNLEANKKISATDFVPYLGAKSKEFCKKWDEFTGTQTPGFYD